VSTIEELLGRKSSGSGQEIREYGLRDLSLWPRDTLYLQRLALTLPTSGGRSFGIVRFRTKATEFVCFVLSSGHVTSRFSALSQRLKSGLKGQRFASAQEVTTEATRALTSKSDFCVASKSFTDVGKSVTAQGNYYEGIDIYR
jgi:hypothetical protein